MKVYRQADQSDGGSIDDAERNLKSSHEGKKQYSNLELAAAVARAMSDVYRQEFGAYKCNWCTGYHVGRTHRLYRRQRY